MEPASLFIIACAKLRLRLRSHSSVAFVAAFVVSLSLLACDNAPAREAPVAAPGVSAGPDAGEGATLGKPPAAPEFSDTTRYRGLWVLCEGSQRVLEDPAKIERLIADAHALDVTDLFVQVYRGGRAWFQSEQADAGPYRAMLADQGSDPLASLIAQAHASGLRVHAWVNVLSLSHNREAPILRDLGRAAIHVDRRGRSILDYPASLELPASDTAWYRVGTPGLYLDPAAPGVAERLVATFRELVTHYPQLDGLHLDYIRHPGVLPFVPGSRFGVGIDYGYGPESMLRFRRETGVQGPFANGAAPDPSRIVNADRWDHWRRDKVTQLVAKIGAATSEVVPSLRLSAAVISYADRAYLSLSQDWRRWLEDGLLDFAVPMVYSKDDRLFRYQVESFAQGPNAQRIWAGVGVWLFENEPLRARAQVEIANRAPIAGDALFSYDSIASARDALRSASGPGDTQMTGDRDLFSVLADTDRGTPPAPAARESAP